MQVTKHYCDHCGKELDEMKDYPEMTIDVLGIWETVDLCSNCHDTLKEYIKNFIFENAKNKLNSKQVIDTVKEGKLPPLESNSTFGLQTIM